MTRRTISNIGASDLKMKKLLWRLDASMMSSSLVAVGAGLYDTTLNFNFIGSSNLKTEMLLRRLDGSMMSVLMSKMLG